ncbi:outer membrane lipoprotein SlyB [Pseudomonas sp. LAMO17WK12:I10]|uniref:glycine zipper 2TM domain-containing protein n=1 Tax=unclassified Pseudomonas TaxID=196821 RepID=UPI000BC72308|nr:MULTISPECIES: glycine zipper 2TM domain-containing protein [unclassified Pseudomonas]PXX64448.1 outer membrane lipoprotein SlyB [Pseudomonas sp. LAMO17WK12:I9]SNY39131.1 outer membrane lipoprotein SlyB [Pseudomonas sp. LAMO17WK12:I10]
MNTFISWLTVTLVTVLISACAAVGSAGGGAGEIEIRSGKIEQISLTQMQTNHDSGVGAVLGGLAGVGLGSLIGRGTGRDVAMVAGALAGAVGGNYAEKKKYDQPIEAQQIIVRVRSGVLVSVTQPINPSLGKGMNVYIQGSGNDARVVPQGG